MAAYKDGKKWKVLFYYAEEGKRKQKHKRGFSTKREALEWEREFLLESTFSMNMKFKGLYNLYMKDSIHRIKEKTYLIKDIIFQHQILPYFGEMEVSKINAVSVRNFQNDLISSINPRSNKKYSSHYIKKINAQLSSIFNFAVNFHGLKENPCLKAGALNLIYEKKMNIWTLEEFTAFTRVIKHKPISYAGFNVLFCTGIRIGELLALTRKDVDLKNKTINISKSYGKVNGKDIISTPKTQSSNRIISIPDKLVGILKEYFDRIYDLSVDDRIFNVTQYVFRNDIERHSEKAGVKKIRIHDLRHSHASMLINANVNPLAISKRLGHAKVDMTLNTYSHLYPSSEEKLLEILNKKLWE
ncbi:site-specific integrase [Ilyobacter sp.]|uniref:site-specific integrase n=1 Tax=Ilyobacter sp. TaxID=3100343 RepID=UPI003564D805